MIKYALIFGCGYTAKYLARMLSHAGYTIVLTSRSAASQILTYGEVIDYTKAHDAATKADFIVSTVPPHEGGEPVLQDYQTEMKSAAQHGAWISYLSTTGVYGDWQGQWVDESSPPRAATPRTLSRLAIEKQWQALGATVFRLAGIYGPGRNALEQIKQGSARRIDKPGQVFSRIHVEDIAGAVAHCIERNVRNEIINLADNEPCPAHKVVSYAAELLDVTPPPLVPYEAAEMSPMAKEFYESCRRVGNRKLTQRLGYKPRYPTYREGLKSLLGNG